MVITIEKIPGAELNRRKEEERSKLATYCLQNKITISTGTWIEHEENVDYTITDMSQATMEEQEEFMEKRRQERLEEPYPLPNLSAVTWRWW